MSSGKVLAILKRVKYSEGMAKKRLPPEIRAYFVEMGKIGGRIGGLAKAAKMTPEQRSENARKAVSARWAKSKSGKDPSRGTLGSG